MCAINWDLTIKALTLIAVAIGAWKGIREIQNAQKWKRVEFLANEYKKFLDDPYVQKTFIMLDGYSILIPVLKNEIDGQTAYIDFNTAKLINALTNAGKEHTRPKDEVYIRLCVDKFLFKLGIFQSYLDSKLVTKEQLQSYFEYWIKIIGDKDDPVIDKEAKLTLYKFIREYEYKGTLALLQTFGYAIPMDKFTPVIKNA